MSIFDDAVDFVADTASDIGDAVAEGFSGVGQGFLDVVGAGVDVLGAGFDAMGTGLSDFDETFGVTDTFGEAWDVATDVVGVVTDPVFSAMEDSGFFDVLEVATLSLVDVEYGEDGLSVDFGIEDVYGFGMTIGSNGVSGDIDAAGMGVDASLNDHGFSAGGSVGWDWGPLPNAQAHVSVDEAGDFGVGGRVEGYLPSPSGFSGGEVGMNYQETPEGFRVDGSFTARQFAPSGTYAGAGVHFGYEEDADGYHTNVGIHAEAGQLGGPEVHTSIDYNESRQGDVTTSGVSVSTGVSAPGVEIDSTAAYTHVETPDGEYDVVTGSATVSGAGVTAHGDASVISGPDGVSFDADGSLDVNDPLTAGKQLASVAGVDVPGTDELGLPGMDDLPDLPGLDDAGQLLQSAGLDPSSIPDLPGDVPGLDDAAQVLRSAGVDPTAIPDLPDVVPDPGQLIRQALPDVPQPAEVLKQVVQDVAPDVPIPVVPDLPTVDDMAEMATSSASSALDDALADADDMLDDTSDDL